MSRRRIGVLEHNEATRRGSCLERFRAMHAYDPRMGGPAYPAYKPWSHYQGPAAREAEREHERRQWAARKESLRRETGLVVVGSVEMREIAAHA